ncbi:hypothetical protein F2Q69_00042691 [Brassica cretica]|uniref:non-specific serine/threonine protein kinase n=1 Tax=Brassica cretica TaxID=69181 RepID=A0A8S9NPL5_BRACR|nr:hypothetical protein F2Q69_00042691 [Brassica cretica]
MTSLFPSTKNHISYRIIWMIFVIPSCVYSASVELHRLCSAPFSCGNQEGLFYPFWISGREACGHPDFKLNCSGGFAEFTISSAKFIILEANSTSRVVRLARSDYTGDLCPPYPLNSPLFNEYVLPFATGTEMMTIYYGCPEVSQTDSTYLGDLDCEDDDDDDEKSYYVSRNRSSLALGEICKRHVSIPADGTSLNTLQSVPTLGSLTNGFKLGANRECWACEYSKGACGYNQSSNGFVCYCIDGHQNVTCGSSSWNKGLSTVAKAGLSTGKKAGIGTALGLVGIILIAGDDHMISLTVDLGTLTASELISIWISCEIFCILAICFEVGPAGRTGWIVTCSSSRFREKNLVEKDMTVFIHIKGANKWKWKALQKVNRRRLYGMKGTA